MVQKFRTIMNGHVTVSHQTVPERIIGIANTSATLLLTVKDNGKIKELFDDFCGSFNDNIDFQTTVDWFTSQGLKVS